MTWFDPTQWPWDPHFHPTQDGKLHYVDVGSGPPILFVHGTPTWAFEWRHAIAGLEHQRRCLAVDHLGFGLSDRPEAADYTPEAHAARFAAFADALDLRDLTVVLHDFGGPIGLDWVLEHPERVSKLVIVNSFGWSLEHTPRFAWPGWLMGSWLGRWLYRNLNLSLRVIAPSAYAQRARWTEVAPNYTGAFTRRDDRVRVLWALARALLGSSAYYETLERRMARLAHTPIDLIWGVADSAFTLEDRDRWLKLLPHARSVEIPDAGHWPHEEQPQAFLAALG